MRRVLEQAGFDVCAEVSDSRAAVKTAAAERPDLCLLGGETSIEAVGEIKARMPDCAVVVLAASSDSDDLFAALQAGADGYLLKDMDPERLPHALRGVLEGEAAIPRALVARVIDDYRKRDRPRRLRIPGVELTERETEVVEGMRAGLGTAEIAARLGVSPVTVRRHVSAVLRKLGAADRKSALRLLEEGTDGGSGRR